jgi:hypothetical protein
MNPGQIQSGSAESLKVTLPFSQRRKAPQSIRLRGGAIRCGQKKLAPFQLNKHL